MSAVSIFNAVLNFGSVIMLAVGALLPIVDPLGGAPIYLAMTAGLTSADRSRMAKAVAINSFLLLVASALIGAYVLDFFGLSIPSVQVAGGIVVCMIGWSLLNTPNAPPALDRNSAQQSATPADLSQRAFYPMTMPLTVGPGSISVALTLGANPAPLRAWVQIRDTAEGEVRLDAFARRVLRCAGGDAVQLRLLAMPPLPKGMAG